MSRNNVMKHRSNDLLVREDASKTQLGFWIYLMTDVMLFGALFATFLVLRANTYGGPTEKELYHLPFILTETILLLASSYSCGLAVLALHKRNLTQVIALLALTFVLGSVFLAMEMTEFTQLVSEGNSWQASASLSSFFTLVATHGLHITVGLLWLSVVVWQLLRKGITANTERKTMLFSMFWHFLDVIWIFIFTIVYLIGVA